MITTLNINNMKCFSDFSVKDLRQITLVSGRNNVGKTSFLESIFILFNGLNPNIFQNINFSRNILGNILTPNFIWEHLFSNLDITYPLFIATGDYSIKLYKDSGITLATADTQKLIPFPILNNSENYILKAEYNSPEDKIIGNYIITINGLVFSSHTNYSIKIFDKYNAIYLPSKAPVNNSLSSKWFDFIQKNKLKNNLISFIRQFDENIDDIFVIYNDNLPCFMYSGHKIPTLPINSLGGGLSNLITIVMAIISNPNSIILIDEIENGFHYSFYHTLWKLIFDIAIQYNCQIIATTYSYDCISGVLQALDYYNKNIFSYIRLDNSEDKIKAHIFLDDIFEYSIISNYEIR
ncbi:MAG: ATP-binding protein [Deltaproteobacteria bacterium]|jgi:AAA15 family ATPase/GTPase|nr:ATP-binding protein [Deltaproteobacteria bacterium]